MLGKPNLSTKETTYPQNVYNYLAMKIIKIILILTGLIVYLYIFGHWFGAY